MSREISHITFKSLVHWGGHGHNEWLASDAKLSAGGRTSIEINDQRRVVIIAFESGAVKSWTETPFENISSIVRVPAKEPQKQEQKK